MVGMAMRILLFHMNVTDSQAENPGLAIISACLKQKGHKVMGIRVHGQPIDYDSIREFNPDIAGFSAVSAQYKYIKPIADKLTCPVIIGGSHATLVPEKILQDFDMVCVGDGEEAFMTIADKFDKGLDYTDTNNIWTKTKRNEVYPLSIHPDDLPFFDRDLFDQFDTIGKRDYSLTMFAGRGTCAFNCPYCKNNKLHKLYKTKQPYRFRTPNNIFKEIAEVAKRSKIKRIKFVDDLFTMDRDWVLDFCKRYPFDYEWNFLTRVGFLDRELCEALKDGGCGEVRLGIESGSDRVRTEVLNRKMSNEAIVDTIKMIKDAGLRVMTLNILGSPTETKDELMETIKINSVTRPYAMRTSILYPYEGTDMYEMTKDIINVERYANSNTYFDTTPLDLKDITPAEVNRYRHMFRWYVDASSNIEASPIFKALIKCFEALPQDMWLTGEAQKLFDDADSELDKILREKKMEHYVMQGYKNDYCEINYAKETGYDSLFWNLCEKVAEVV